MYVCMYAYLGAGQHEESLLSDEQHSPKLRVLLRFTSVAEYQNLAVSVLPVSVFSRFSRQVLTTESEISSAFGSVPTQCRYVCILYTFRKNIFEKLINLFFANNLSKIILVRGLEDYIRAFSLNAKEHDRDREVRI